MKRAPIDTNEAILKMSRDLLKKASSIDTLLDHEIERRKKHTKVLAPRLTTAAGIARSLHRDLAKLYSDTKEMVK